jgi:hypothetical protein
VTDSSAGRARRIVSHPTFWFERTVLPVRSYWLKHELIFGAIFAVILTAFNLASNLAPLGSSISDLSRTVSPVLIFILLPFSYVIAGFINGRRRQKTTSGTFAGVITAATSGVILIVSLLLIMYFFWNTVLSNAMQDPFMNEAFLASGEPTFGQFLWGDQMTGVGFVTIILLIVGLLFGTVGGFVGAMGAKRQAKLRPGR